MEEAKKAEKEGLSIPKWQELTERRALITCFRGLSPALEGLQLIPNNAGGFIVTGIQPGLIPEYTFPHDAAKQIQQVPSNHYTLGILESAILNNPTLDSVSLRINRLQGGAAGQSRS